MLNNRYSMGVWSKMSFSRHIVAALFCTSVCVAQDRLTPTYYDQTCPYVTHIIRKILLKAFLNDTRITASLLRLHFHDCFVQKVARPNANSVRGFEVIDEMKAALENVCSQTISCADIVAIASEQSVVLDSRSANRSLANTTLPGFNDPLDLIKAKFAAVGLDTILDVVALSARNRLNNIRCINIFNFGCSHIRTSSVFSFRPKIICPTVGLTNLTNLTTPDDFDNVYFNYLQVEEGVLRSDQILFRTQGTNIVEIDNQFSCNQTAFFEAFAESMIRMGNMRGPQRLWLERQDSTAGSSMQIIQSLLLERMLGLSPLFKPRFNHLLCVLHKIRINRDGLVVILIQK
ncbi:peroxidase A2-like [Gossypium australe]|uniref:Peroxidase n=1 Tax=Gossypium australe TaxID=47621 RepID=A0A5B6VNM8_9ROSI|nr:peroxidase A2-like [Gossypium australe]